MVQCRRRSGEGMSWRPREGRMREGCRRARPAYWHRGSLRGWAAGRCGPCCWGWRSCQGEGSAGDGPEDFGGGEGDRGVEAAHQVAEEAGGWVGGDDAGADVVADGNYAARGGRPGVGQGGDAGVYLVGAGQVGPDVNGVHGAGQPECQAVDEQWWAGGLEQREEVDGFGQ